jgi:hypothetical protein
LSSRYYSRKHFVKNAISQFMNQELMDEISCITHQYDCKSQKLDQCWDILEGIYFFIIYNMATRRKFKLLRGQAMVSLAGN